MERFALTAQRIGSTPANLEKVQENLRLIRALEKYDPDLGLREPVELTKHRKRRPANLT